MPLYWLEDMNELLNGYLEFMPNKSMTLNEKLNALTRFSIYMIILFFIINSNIIWYYLPTSIIILTIIIHKIDKNSVILNNGKNIIKNDETCSKPTINNPFMNVLQSDYTNNPQRKEACKDMDNDEEFFDNMYRNVDNVFMDNMIKRQYYTTPATTIPNNQQKFANWLYKIPKTCKQDNYNCLLYEDIRFGKTVFGKPFG